MIKGHITPYAQYKVRKKNCTPGTTAWWVESFNGIEISQFCSSQKPVQRFITVSWYDLEMAYLEEVKHKKHLPYVSVSLLHSNYDMEKWHADENAFYAIFRRSGAETYVRIPWKKIKKALQKREARHEH